jgi:endonuclease/exonuclease/phosphatase family metal-dependent hydrolase
MKNMLAPMIGMMLAFGCLDGFAKTISLMTYNAENLFDVKHDVGKKDWKWLPAAFKKSNPQAKAYCAGQGIYKNYCMNYDWNQKALDEKIKNLANAIRAYEGYKGPDIIVMQEVENLAVLQELARKGLAKDKYKYVALMEGPDTRGIDIGVISRYPIIYKKLHKVDLRGTSGAHRTTRGILEIEIKVGSKVVTVLGNHWPSQGNDDDTRLRASEILENIIYKIDTDLVVATGDFNTQESDSPHSIKTNVLPYFYDSEEIFRSRASYLNPGSHWYKGYWTSLDKIFVLKRSVYRQNIKVIWDSFSIINNSFLVKRDHEWRDAHGVTRVAHNIPYRFDMKTLKGASDHLPVAVKFEL